MKTKDLKNAYSEMIKVLDLVDAKTKEPLVVSKKATAEELIDSIKKYASFIEEEDEFSDETQSILDEILIEKEDDEEDEIPVSKTKKLNKEVIEEDEDEYDLIEEVQDAESILELKELVKESDIFKPLRKGIGLLKDKDLGKLRKKMLDLLSPDTEEEQEEKEEVKPVKKSESKKYPAKKAPVKREVKKTIKRSDSVANAIKLVCKKGGSFKEIMDKSNEIHIQNGGKSNPTATNVNKYMLDALVAFNVITFANGKYKLV
jgi:hypothetical protein